MYLSLQDHGWSWHSLDPLVLEFQKMPPHSPFYQGDAKHSVYVNFEPRPWEFDPYFIDFLSWPTSRFAAVFVLFGHVVTKFTKMLAPLRLGWKTRLGILAIPYGVATILAMVSGAYNFSLLTEQVRALHTTDEQYRETLRNLCSVLVYTISGYAILGDLFKKRDGWKAAVTLGILYFALGMIFEFGDVYAACDEASGWIQACELILFNFESLLFFSASLMLFCLAANAILDQRSQVAGYLSFAATGGLVLFLGLGVSALRSSLPAPPPYAFDLAEFSIQIVADAHLDFIRLSVLALAWYGVQRVYARLRPSREPADGVNTDPPGGRLAPSSAQG